MILLGLFFVLSFTKNRPPDESYIIDPDASTTTQSVERISLRGFLRPINIDEDITSMQFFELPDEIRDKIWKNVRNQRLLTMVRHYRQVFQVADMFAEWAILAQDVDTHYDLDGLGTALWQCAFDHLLAVEDGQEKYVDYSDDEYDSDSD